MTRFVVYQQIVTKTKKVKGMELDVEVRMIVRKVEAETRAKAITAFTNETAKIKRKRESTIGCFDFDLAGTVKYKRKRRTTGKK